MDSEWDEALTMVYDYNYAHKLFERTERFLYLKKRQNVKVHKMIVSKFLTFDVI